ncbi:MAG TPA: FkbM family methyltransferase [Verrucomicrobiota bacterium]|nr:FkbM family methyltransferase [Verrucomicrobiota bacterium]
MKNPLIQSLRCWREWRRQQKLHDRFAFTDALMQSNRVIFPARLHTISASRRLAREAEITPASGAWQVCLRDSGLSFFWPSKPDQNLHFVIEQEFFAANPHHYTSAPIRLSAESTVIDVGACEGLFAFRTLARALARRIVCFEPSECMADLLQRGADANNLTDGITIVRSGVGSLTGQARMVAGDNPDAGYLDYLPSGESHADAVPVTSIDDYCRNGHLALGQSDLIKADAEGADLDVLLGAEEQIRNGAPQLAITTYHVDDHAERMIAWLRKIRPDYSLRLKGFSFWTAKPRPVLLQASTLQ